jgi:hypothetical protein
LEEEVGGSWDSNTIAQFGNTFLLGAVSTTKDRVVFFDSMTNDVGATTRASRCQGLDGTFETIECVAGAIHDYLESLVVFVTAGLAFRPGVPLIKLMSEQTIAAVAGSIFSPWSSRLLHICQRATPKITL